jgi:hypothetical protein
MVSLTEQQRRLVTEQSGGPVPLIDDQTNRVYYLVPAEKLEQIRALLADEPFDPAELYPLISRAAAAAGWADPATDAYYDFLETPSEPEN